MCAASVADEDGKCAQQVWQLLHAGTNCLGDDFPVAQDFTVKLLQKGAREYQQGRTGWDQDPLVFHGFPWVIQVFKPFHT